MHKLIFVILLGSVYLSRAADSNDSNLEEQPKAEKLTASDSFHLLSSLGYHGGTPYYANEYSYDKYLVPTAAPVYTYYQNYQHPTYTHYNYNPYEHHGLQNFNPQHLVQQGHVSQGGLQQVGIGQLGLQNIPQHGLDHVSGQHGLQHVPQHGLQHGGQHLLQPLQRVRQHVLQPVTQHVPQHGLQSHGLEGHSEGLGHYQGGHNAYLQHYEHAPYVYDHSNGHHLTHTQYSYTPTYHTTYDGGNNYHGHGLGNRYYGHNLGYPLYQNRLHRFGTHH